MKSPAIAVVIAVLLSVGLSMTASAQDNTQSQTPAQPSVKSEQSQAANDASIPVDAADATAATAGAPKATHDKGKNDIDNIGNRKVGGTGKSLGNWYSIDTDVKLGKQTAMMIEASAHMIQDPVITEYVNRVGQSLVRNSDAKVPFSIKVVDSDDINAVALPGGFFYVNSGVILAADNEAELAGVMAHEIAHVAARHATKEMTRRQYVGLATIPLIFVIHGWGTYQLASAALNFGVPVAMLKFDRGAEAEADYLGLQYMYKAGYDPDGMVSIFEKLKALDKTKPGSLAKVFSDHPPTPDRIIKCQDEIRNVLPSRPEYILDTSEFDQVKARLAALENRKKAIPADEQRKPSLRRTQTADKGKNEPGKDGKDGDDRPTLQKRDDYAAATF
jgi:predicted Zn-dependent protease